MTALEIVGILREPGNLLRFIVGGATLLVLLWLCTASFEAFPLVDSEDWSPAFVGIVAGVVVAVCLGPFWRRITRWRGSRATLWASLAGLAGVTATLAAALFLAANGALDGSISTDIDLVVTRKARYKNTFAVFVMPTDSFKVDPWRFRSLPR